MTALIALVPGVSYGGPTDEAWEAGWEHVEQVAPRPFSRRDIAHAAGWTAARYVVRAGLALDLIERISPKHARPVLYRVTEHAMPRGDGTGPTGPTPTGPTPTGPTQPPAPSRAA